MKKKQVYALLGSVVFFLIWSLYVFYPNPTDLAKSIHRVFNPPISPADFDHLFVKIENDPSSIELAVKDTFPYQYDWVTYNKPWYFPTPQEIIKKGKGDCKTRLLVLASVLEARKIPYSMSASPTHVWINYEGRSFARNELPEMQIMSVNEYGKRVVTVPKVKWKRSARLFKEGFWDYMPNEKKTLFLIGVFPSFLIFFWKDFPPHRFLRGQK